MKKLILILCLAGSSNASAAVGFGSVFSGLMGYSAGKIAAQATTPADNINQAIVQACVQINKSLPYQLNKDTRIESLSPGNKKVTYHYTALTRRSTEVDRTQFRNVMNERMISASCDSDDLRPVLRAGVTVSYEYKGSDGLPIATINVASSQCRVKN